MKVYPRVCGGTRWRDGVQPNDIGLSPRVRGNPPNCDYAQRHNRSIPACAGEPAEAVEALRLEAVYPRVCGGTATARDAEST